MKTEIPSLMGIDPQRNPAAAGLKLK
jgi:hypothetical protein